MKLVKEILSKIFTKNRVQFGAIAAVLFFVFTVCLGYNLIPSMLGALLTFVLGMIVHWTGREKIGY